MKTIALWFVAAFVMFFAIGYQMGTKIESDPYKMAAIVANNSKVSFNGSELTLSVYGSNKEEYWRLKLGTKEELGLFQNSDLIKKSLLTKSISAESEMLLEFIGGGAVLTITGKEIFLDLMNKGKSDIKIKLAKLVGGVSGFSLGYFLGKRSINIDSPEVLSFLRDSKNIEIVKKTTFGSMVSSREFDIAKLQKGVELPNCKDQTRTGCIVEKTQKELNLIEVKAQIAHDAISKLSNDEKNIEGYEFIIFFI